MINFTEDQQMLRKAVREFVEAEIAPHAKEWDEKDICPVHLFPALGEMGIIGTFVPEEYGGAGLGFVERTICLEELARHSAGLAITVMAHQLGYAAILFYGTEEQKKKYLPDLAGGKKVCGLSLTEPTGGSDFMGQKSTGELIDGKWVLNGRKCFVTNAGLADVDIWTVVTGKNEKGKSLLTAFIVEKGMPGYTSGRIEHKIGMHSSVTGEVICKNVRLSPEQMIQKEGNGAKIGMATIQEVGRAGMSAICTGITRGCLEDSLKFANDRIIYGNPLHKLVTIQLALADNRLDYDTSMLLTYRGAARKDAKLPCGTEFAMSKYYSTEAAVRSAKRTMDMMGAYGVINEYAIGRYLRDALAGSAAGGTQDIQKLVIAAGTLNGN